MSDNTPTRPEQWVFEGDALGQPQKITGPRLKTNEVVTLVPLDALRSLAADQDRLATELAEARARVKTVGRGFHEADARADGLAVDLAHAVVRADRATAQRDSLRDALERVRPWVEGEVLDGSLLARGDLAKLDSALDGGGDATDKPDCKGDLAVEGGGEREAEGEEEHDCDEDGEAACTVCGYVSGMYDPCETCGATRDQCACHPTPHGVVGTSPGGATFHASFDGEPDQEQVAAVARLADLALKHMDEHQTRPNDGGMSPGYQCSCGWRGPTSERESHAAPAPVPVPEPCSECSTTANVDPAAGMCQRCLNGPLPAPVQEEGGEGREGDPLTEAIDYLYGCATGSGASDEWFSRLIGAIEAVQVAAAPASSPSLCERVEVEQVGLPEGNALFLLAKIADQHEYGEVRVFYRDPIDKKCRDWTVCVVTDEIDNPVRVSDPDLHDALIGAVVQVARQIPPIAEVKR